MNFFEDQDRARRNTKKLVVLFVLAVLFTLFAVNAVTALIVNATARTQQTTPTRRMVPKTTQVPTIPRRPGDPPTYQPPFQTTYEWEDEPAPPPQVTRATWWRPDIFAIVSLATLAIIGGGSLVKISMLSGGGHTVAEMMGGRRISPSSGDPDERKLLNVVEEMAIAASLPVPPVYVMDQEMGINAFAAGFTPRDAVVAVTAGTLKNLSRDELQGVIGHEFSHILNGDMRINIRLIGILFGILLIALIGWQAVRVAAQTSTGSRKEDGRWRIAVIVIGLCLVVIGYIGYFLGRLMQAAVSRQREFLADASSVQFTRNPNGIAGALKKIGGLSMGSTIADKHAIETSHMLFGDPVTHAFSSMLATHPPLAERIRRLDPSFTGALPAKRDGEWNAQPAAAAGFAGATSGAVRVAPSGLADLVGRVSPEHVASAVATVSALPEALVAAAREPSAAPAMVFSLLLNREAEPRARQLDYLARNVNPAIAQQTELLSSAALGLSHDARLPLLAISFPALRQLSAAQINGFFQSVKMLIEADHKIELFEYSLFKLLQQQLAPGQHPSISFFSIKPLLDDAAVMIAALSYAGDKEPLAAAQAFSAGMARFDGAPTTLPPAPGIPQIDTALSRLAQAAPGIKRRFIDAAAHCVAADGIVQTEEAELLRAVCAVLECPMPPILGEQVETAQA